MEKGKQTADTVRFSESSGSIKMFFWSCNLSTYVLLTTSFINLLQFFSQINTQSSLYYQGNCETVVKLISFGPGIIKGIENRLTGKKITGRYLPLHPCKMGSNPKKCFFSWNQFHEIFVKLMLGKNIQFDFTRFLAAKIFF